MKRSEAAFRLDSYSADKRLGCRNPPQLKTIVYCAINQDSMKKKLLATLAGILFLSYCFAQSTPAFKGSKYGNNTKAGHYADIRGFKMYMKFMAKGSLYFLSTAIPAPSIISQRRSLFLLKTIRLYWQIAGRTENPWIQAIH